MPAIPPATPYQESARLTYDGGSSPLPVGFSASVDARDFGVIVRPHNGSFTQAEGSANLAAIQAALDWSAQAGGMVVFPSGLIEFRGTVTLPLGASFRGQGTYETKLRQQQQPQSASESFTDMFVAPPVSGQTGGNGFNIIEDLTIDGGWNMRSYEGATHINWLYPDPERMTQRGLVLHCPSNGPSGNTVKRAQGTDMQSRVRNVFFTNIAGYGIDTAGRGEIMVYGCEFSRMAKASIDHKAPDCWIGGNSMYLCGEAGIIVRSSAGDLRMTHNKFWFCGMQGAVEPESGSGIYLPDPGTKNVNITNTTIQDTFGAGIDFQGDYGIYFQGSIDNPGGGRVEQQKLGFQGERTLARTAIRIGGTARHMEIHAVLVGSANIGAVPRPQMLVNQGGGGMIGCRVYLTGEYAKHAQPFVSVTQGTINAKRYNEVWFEGKLIHGWLSPDDLDDAAHGVNEVGYGPTLAYLTTGCLALRAPDGTWHQLCGGGSPDPTASP